MSHRSFTSQHFAALSTTIDFVNGLLRDVLTKLVVFDEVKLGRDLVQE